MYLTCLPDVADRYTARAVAFLERNLREYGYGCILCCSGYSPNDSPLLCDVLKKAGRMQECEKTLQEYKEKLRRELWAGGRDTRWVALRLRPLCTDEEWEELAFDYSASHLFPIFAPYEDDSHEYDDMIYFRNGWV